MIAGFLFFQLVNILFRCRFPGSNQSIFLGPFSWWASKKDWQNRKTNMLVYNQLHYSLFLPFQPYQPRISKGWTPWKPLCLRDSLTFQIFFMQSWFPGGNRWKSPTNWWRYSNQHSRSGLIDEQALYEALMQRQALYRRFGRCEKNARLPAFLWWTAPLHHHRPYCMADKGSRLPQ